MMLRADRRLDRHVEHLARDQLAHLRRPPRGRGTGVWLRCTMIDSASTRSPLIRMSTLTTSAGAELLELVVHRGVAARHATSACRRSPARPRPAAARRSACTWRPRYCMFICTPRFSVAQRHHRADVVLRHAGCCAVMIGSRISSIRDRVGQLRRVLDLRSRCRRRSSDLVDDRRRGGDQVHGRTRAPAAPARSPCAAGRGSRSGSRSPAPGETSGS